jgi:hypothetical protein
MLFLSLLQTSLKQTEEETKKECKQRTDPSENNGGVWGWKGNFSMTWKTAGMDMRTVVLWAVVLCHNVRGFPAF